MMMDIEKLTKYMCFEKNLVTKKEEEEEEPVIVIQDVQSKCKSKLTSVEPCNDPLFWSIYLAVFGRKEYERVGHETKVGREEMKEKSKMSEHFYTNGAAYLSTLLQTRITKKACSEMATNILTERKLSWTSLYVVCAFYECNIYVVDLEKNVYMKYVLNNSEKYNTYILYKTRGDKYYIDCKEEVMSLDELSKRYLKIASYEKPLLGISNYKVSDLVHFANQIELNHEMKNKKELYDMIAIYCSS